MSNILRSLKINFLSLLALPFLLTAVAAKLLSKALEKIMVFLGVGLVILALALLNEMLNNPGSFLDGLGTVLAACILFGGIILLAGTILLFLGTIAASAVTVVVSVLTAVLEGIFNFSYGIYSSLSDICGNEYSRLEGSGIKYTCLSWYLLTGIAKLTALIFSAALPLSIAGAAGFTGYAVWTVHRHISSTFGIGIFPYLKLFTTTNAVFAVLYFVITVLAAVVVIIALGAEWSEWGSTLRCASGDYKQYRSQIRKKASALGQNTSVAFTAGKNAERCEAAMDIFRKLMDETDFLCQQADAASSVRRDTSLSYDLAAYMDTMNEISSQIRQYGMQIPCNEFEKKLIPLILKAEKLKKAVEKEAFSILDAQCRHTEKNSEVMDFFGGCETQEDLRQRYRSLCKVYHPDVGGHEETFKLLQNQYEQKMGQFPSQA